MSLTVVPEADAPPVLQVGDSLGPYVLEQLLGEGTMGRVYQGRHQRLGRKVALKVLHPHLIQDKTLVARFLQEARLVNQINHAHIVEVHDFVEELFPERVYGVMELLQGKTLAAQLAERALTLLEICNVGKQIADALHAAHRVDVVHRDLKPDNIFLTSREGREDSVKVLDFGVAKLLQTGGDLRVADTQAGTMVGTPRYMAPEQAAGLEVDARTDIYALGTILYEMLAGKPPFESTVFGQLAADIITQPPPPLPARTQAGEPIPKLLQDLVATCLAKSSDARPVSMAAVSTWLERAMQAPPPKPPPPKALLAAGAMAMVLGLVVTFLLLRPDPPPAVVQPVVQPPVVVAPPPPVVVVPTDVWLSIVTTPAGASVSRLDTGAALGVTPLKVQLPKADQPLRLRFELAGHQTLEREASLQSDQTLELSLKPIVIKQKPRPVTDGVLDPF
ncbi:MAG: serine/threonine-protein kinase [Archangium sp.]|nr:serine/threonine-protein kinase [Archangium sp.]